MDAHLNIFWDNQHGQFLLGRFVRCALRTTVFRWGELLQVTEEQMDADGLRFLIHELDEFDARRPMTIVEPGQWDDHQLHVFKMIAISRGSHAYPLQLQIWHLDHTDAKRVNFGESIDLPSTTSQQQFVAALREAFSRCLNFRWSWRSPPPSPFIEVYLDERFNRYVLLRWVKVPLNTQRRAETLWDSPLFFSRDEMLEHGLSVIISDLLTFDQRRVADNPNVWPNADIANVLGLSRSKLVTIHLQPDHQHLCLWTHDFVSEFQRHDFGRHKERLKIDGAKQDFLNALDRCLALSEQVTN